MNDRAKAMGRIAAVREQMKRMEEWKLAAAEARKRQVADERRGLDAFVAAGDMAGPMAGPIAALAVGQARRLAQRDVAAERQCQRQQGAVHAAQRRHKQATEAADVLLRAARDARERKDLAELIEATLATDGGGGAIGARPAVASDREERDRP